LNLPRADAGRVRQQAAELVALAPDVILATGSVTLRPLLRATRAVPIVFATSIDPIGAGNGRVLELMTVPQ
jgi:putative ABC transport system substrate-binding protein